MSLEEGISGGKQEGGKVVEIRHVTTLQPKSGEKRGISVLTCKSPPPNCILSRFNQVERVATNGRSINSETVYSRNVSKRVSLRECS